MASGANGGTITSRLKEEAVVTSTNKTTACTTENSVHASSFSASLQSQQLHSPSPVFHSSLWNTRTWFFFFYPLSISPCLTAPTPTSFFFLICLPTQSGLILLVTLDIWGPAHAVWLSSRETFPWETLWIRLHTRRAHERTPLQENTHLY